jgi:C1A family cysteine protease
MNSRVHVVAFVLLGTIASCKTVAQRGKVEGYGRRDNLWDENSLMPMGESQLLDYLYGQDGANALKPEVLKDILQPAIPLDQLVTDEDEPIENDLYTQVEAKSGKTGKTLRAKDLGNEDVDLRKFDTSIRNQGDSSLCSAFATNAALEHVAKRKSGIDLDLSEKHLFSRYGRFYTDEAVDASKATMVVPESVWPMESENPKTTTQGKGIVQATDVGYKMTRMSQIIRELRAGNPVVIGATALTPLLLRGGMLNKSGKNDYVGHAMLIVGVFFNENFVNEGGGVLILKNSYGVRSGDKGYAYMPLDYCNLLEGRRCWAWAFRDVAINETALPGKQDNNLAPPVTPVGPPAPPTAPLVAISASDFSLRVNYIGWQGRERVFQIQLVGDAEKVAAVKSVTFKIHSSFGQYATYTTTGEDGVFSTDNYRTYARRWRTNGATIEGKNGERFDIPGVMLNW